MPYFVFLRYYTDIVQEPIVSFDSTSKDPLAHPQVQNLIIIIYIYIIIIKRYQRLQQRALGNEVHKNGYCI